MQSANHHSLKIYSQYPSWSQITAYLLLYFDRQVEHVSVAYIFNITKLDEFVVNVWFLD